MRTSESIDQILPALIRAKAQIKNPDLDKTVNGRFSFRYASLTSCLNAVTGPLAAEGIAPMCDASPGDDGASLYVSARLWHSSGQWIASGALRIPCDARDAKAIGGAQTYGFRYSLCALCGIAGEEDRDAHITETPAPATTRETCSLERAEQIAEQFDAVKTAEEGRKLADSLTPEESAHPEVKAAKNAARERVAA